MARRLKDPESSLIKALLKGTKFENELTAQIGLLQVEEMQDGEMGSLRVVRPHKKQSLGAIAAQAEFTDEDDVPVSVTLNLNQDGELFELDIFKADFSPLKKFPEIE
ncbi:DUF6984 family protein [Hufsiella ginkgonis]|uniref:DUF6984 domain-containing protein n=1 Tax=Hufsiella ginkgonis TaxID=2695274 RepID=A0A7K1XT83_9SPHI|nr:hypothetical protein [Hufsiella ginkgonis]MXV14164.1 hypothetical protein [Hufsiella ginkgonis]